MARQYDRFDEATANIGASLVLSNGDTVLQTSANVNAHRCARGTQYQDTDVSSVEFYFWSPNASSPGITSVAGVPPICFGIVTSSANKSKYVGEDAYGFGYCPGDGKVYNNGSVVATLATAALGDYIKVTVDPVNALFIVSLNGTALTDGISITSGQAWTFAATVSGNPGDLAIWETPGNPPMRYRDADEPGWWVALDGITPVLVATEPYMTAATDTPRHEKYTGDLDRTTRPPAISDSMSFWTFGQSAPRELGSGGLLQYQINDPTATAQGNGKWGRLLDDGARLTPVAFQLTQSGSVFSGAGSVFTGLFDHAEPHEIQTIICYARSMLEALNVPLRRAVIPPGADPSAANLPFPMALGVCRNYEPTLLDAVTRTYAIHDGAVSNFGINREAGKPLTLGTDISVTADGGGVIYPSGHPLGKATIESTSTGAAFDPGATDYLAGIGDFRSASSLSPWTAGYFHAAGSIPVLTGSSPHKFVRMPNAPDAIGWIVETTYKARAGYGYAFSINALAVPYYGPIAGGGSAPPAKLAIGYFTGTAIVFTNWVKLDLTSAKTYTGFFQNNTGSDQQVVIAHICNSVVSPTTNFDFDQVYFNELPPVADNVDLEGPGLTQMIHALAIDRGPLDPQQVSTTESDAIDTATGYRYGLMVSPNENPTIAECLKRVLDSSTSAMYFDGSGKLRVFQLTPPEDVDDADVDFELSYEAGDFLSDLIQIPDLAEGLTTQASGCQNGSPFTDGDFGSTSLADCPNTVRARLKRTDQFTETAGVQLGQRYQQAYQRAPHRTQLDRSADIRSMIVGANTLYVPDRNFYVGDVWMPFTRRKKVSGVWTDVSGDFQLAQSFKITYPVGALATGQKLWLLGYAPKEPSEERCKCIFWGL